MRFIREGQNKLARAATLTCCLLGMLSPVTLRAANGDELFAQAVRAFKEGNYSVAVGLFERARTEGINTPALFYNLGASLYKLRRYADAEQAFRLCVNDPTWAALAHYNIGLTQYQRGQHNGAAEHFERAWRTTDNQEIRALALTMLDRIDGTRASRTRGSFAFNVGHNDNVTLTANDRTIGATQEPDWFVDLTASATGEWGTAADAPYWNASLDNISYAHVSENNTTEIQLDATQPATFERWHTDVGVRYQYFLLRGRALEHIASLRAKATRNVADGVDLHLRTELGTVGAIDDNYDFLDGSHGEIELSLSQRVGGGHVEWGTTFEHDHRRDLDTGTDFLSYSPMRYGLWTWGAWPLGGGWRIESTVSFTRNRYADAERRDGVVLGTREDDELEASLRLRYRLSPLWYAVAEASYTDNDSNFSEFSYKQRILSLGVVRPF